MTIAFNLELDLKQNRKAEDLNHVHPIISNSTNRTVTMVSPTQTLV